MYLLLKLLAKLPLSILQIFAYWIALICMCFPNYGLRRIVRINLWISYPTLDDKARTQLEWATLYSQCLTAVESLKGWGMPPAYSISQIQNIEGKDILLNALHSGQGVIFVVPHLGTWEIMNAWISQYSSMVIMYKPSQNEGVNQFMLQARQSQQATLVPTDESGVRAIFKALKQGGVTAILPDHVPEHNGGLFSPFFGQEVLTTTLVSKLAAKTQCHVIGLSCLRQKGQPGFTMICEKLSDNIKNKDLQISVNTLNAEMQRMISRAPEQYIWSYRRFKRAKDEKLSNIYRMDLRLISKK